MTEDMLFGERDFDEELRKERNRVDAQINFFGKLYEHRAALWEMISKFELEKSMGKQPTPPKPAFSVKPKKLASEVFQLIEACEKVIDDPAFADYGPDPAPPNRNLEDMEMALSELKEALGINKGDCDDGSCKL
jgi:hypothetical protein